MSPKPELLELLKLFNIKNDSTLKSVVEQTQKHWLRNAGTERWQMHEIDVNDAKHSNAIALLTKLGMINEFGPQHNEYDSVFIMGGTASTMQIRMATLYELLMNNTKFSNLIFLVSQRASDDLEESIDGNLPKTETEIAKIIFDKIDWPKEFLKNVNIAFSNTPMQKNDNGLTRPNTSDSIINWLKTNPKPGRCLFISNNPYIGYQNAVVATCLPKEFSFETIGAAANKNEKISIYLDTLARWLYQEQVRLNN